MSSEISLFRKRLEMRVLTMEMVSLVTSHVSCWYCGPDNCLNASFLLLFLLIIATTLPLPNF